MSYAYRSLDKTHQSTRIRALGCKLDKTHHQLVRKDSLYHHLHIQIVA